MNEEIMNRLNLIEAQISEAMDNRARIEMLEALVADLRDRVSALEP